MIHPIYIKILITQEHRPKFEYGLRKNQNETIPTCIQWEASAVWELYSTNWIKYIMAVTQGSDNMDYVTILIILLNLEFCII
jgi:hypothetical protein